MVQISGAVPTQRARGEGVDVIIDFLPFFLLIQAYLSGLLLLDLNENHCEPWWVRALSPMILY